MATMDALNEKMGKGTVCQGLPEKNVPLAPTLREPKLTLRTNWGDLIKVYKDEDNSRVAHLKYYIE